MKRKVRIPEGWISDSNSTNQGGQAKIQFIRHRNGNEGVLRTLKKPGDNKARERFCREVNILSSDVVQHESIVRLLDFDMSTANPWYISERGDSFVAWWQDWKSKHHDPEVVVNKAVGSIRQLADALGMCHSHGVVHRDVKTTNIVVKRGVEQTWPILIDFGLAYESVSERLTDSKESVGNRRFSPDPVRLRMEEIPPWLDVFALAQLMIWMLDEQASAGRAWARPIHWRYAKYDAGLSDETQMALKAFTAACSVESSAPSNGTKCVELLNQLFPEEGHSLRLSTAEHLTRVLAGKRRGIAKKKLSEVRVSEELEASAGVAESVYRDLKRAILTVVGEFREYDETLSVIVDRNFVSRIIGATDLLWLIVGPSDMNIQIRVKVKAIPSSIANPSFAENIAYWRRYLPHDAICYGFAIEGGVVDANDSRFLDGRWITVSKTGGIYIHPLSAGFGAFANNDLGGSVEGPAKSSSIQEIADYVLSLLSNEKYWEYIEATTSRSQ